MTEKGRVIEVQGLRVTIRQEEFGRDDCCFGCMNYECKQKHGHISADNPFGLPLESGLLVETEIRPGFPAAQGVKALLPPILGFIAGFFFSRILFPLASEAAWAFGGVFLMLASGGIFYLFRRRFPAKTQTVVTRIID